jgi:putative sigma-54 modulation protein
MTDRRVALPAWFEYGCAIRGAPPPPYDDRTQAPDIGSAGAGDERSTCVIVTISGRHMEVTEALKNYAEQKAGKLTKYYDLIQEIEVILDAQKDGTKVEIIVNAEHNGTFIAHHDQGDAYACIDGCVDKLERQLTDHKEKHRNRKHPTPGSSSPGGTATSRQRSNQ